MGDTTHHSGAVLTYTCWQFHDAAGFEPSQWVHSDGIAVGIGGFGRGKSI